MPQVRVPRDQRTQAEQPPSQVAASAEPAEAASSGRAWRSTRIRKEAQPFPWKELSEGQKLVARHVQSFVSEFLDAGSDLDDSAWDGESGPFDWRAADVQRPSNVALIDGGRGSGKTSVMLTLVELWRQALARKVSPDREDWWAFRAMSPRESLQWDPSLGGRIIPLRPLSMQPLPSSTLLLTWIANAVQEFGDSLENALPESETKVAQPRRIAGWRPEWPQQRRSVELWERFIQQAAVSWQSSSEPRRTQLDPEAYAYELNQAEHSRHALVRTWRKFVTYVAREAANRFRAIDERACFVLPIDNVDTDAERCVELLELVRLLWHPRLVFLLTGQSRLIVQMLQVQGHGTLNRLLYSTATNDPKVLAAEARPSAHEMAVDTYFKTIPPGQRFAIPRFTPGERFEVFEAIVRSSPPPEALGRFLDLLRKDPVLQGALPPHYRPLHSLAQLLALHGEAPAPAAEGPRTQGEDTAHPVRAANMAVLFQLAWREATDLYWVAGADSAPVHDVVGLRSPDDGTAPELRIQLRGPLERRGRCVRRVYREEGSGTIVRYDFQTTEGFVWRPSSGAEEAPAELCELLHLGVAIQHAERGRLAPGVMPSGWRAPAVQVRWPQLASSGGAEAVFCWPLPDWTRAATFLEFDAEWEASGRVWWPPEPDAALASALTAFLQCVVRTQRASQAQRQTEHAAAGAALEPRTLEDCLTALAQCVGPLRGDPDLDPEDHAFVEWMDQRLPCLAAPESGLPAELALTFLQRWAHIPNLRRASGAGVLATSGRLHRAAVALTEGGIPEAELLARLDAIEKVVPDHPWRSHVLEGATAISSTWISWHPSHGGSDPSQAPQR